MTPTEQQTRFFHYLLNERKKHKLLRSDIPDLVGLNKITPRQGFLLEASFPPIKKEDPEYGYTPRKRSNGKWF